MHVWLHVSRLASYVTYHYVMVTINHAYGATYICYMQYSIDELKFAVSKFFFLKIVVIQLNSLK